MIKTIKVENHPIKVVQNIIYGNMVFVVGRLVLGSLPLVGRVTGAKA